MEELWIIYYWVKIATEKKKNVSPDFGYIELNNDPDNDLFMKEVENRQGAFKTDNPLHEAGIVCKISVRRVKYEDENFECMELGVYRNEKGTDKYLGMVTTDIVSLSKDIYQIALLGSGMVKKDCLEIVHHIECNFYNLATTEKNKADKQYIVQSFKVFTEVYKEYEVYLKTAASKAKTGSSNAEDGLWKNYGYDETQGQFFIPVKDFKEIYDSMDISKEMGITEYKKLLKQNGYSIANQGRNDYTHTVYGKVIALYIKKIEKVLKENNGKP